MRERNWECDVLAEGYCLVIKTKAARKLVSTAASAFGIHSPFGGRSRGKAKTGRSEEESGPR